MCAVLLPPTEDSRYLLFLEGYPRDPSSWLFGLAYHTVNLITRMPAPIPGECEQPDTTSSRQGQRGKYSVAAVSWLV